MIMQPMNETGKKSFVKNSGVEKSLPVKAVSAKQNTGESGNNSAAKKPVSAQGKLPNQIPDTGKLKKIVQGINKNIQVIERELRFSVDKTSGKVIVKVIDLSTKKVVRQIPSEEALNVAKMLSEGEDLKLFSSYT